MSDKIFKKRNVKSKMIHIHTVQCWEELDQETGVHPLGCATLRRKLCMTYQFTKSHYNTYLHIRCVVHYLAHKKK